jgi:hypothetical protein
MQTLIQRVYIIWYSGLLLLTHHVRARSSFTRAVVGARRAWEGTTPMNTAFRTTVLFLASAVAGAATCDRPPNRDETSAVSSPVKVADNPCENRADGATPPGCNAGDECWYQACSNEICIANYIPGASCGNNGTCNDTGVCEEPDGGGGDPECTDSCESERLLCETSCHGDSNCQCQCQLRWANCIWICGGPAPDPEICPASTGRQR